MLLFLRCVDDLKLKNKKISELQWSTKDMLISQYTVSIFSMRSHVSQLSPKVCRTMASEGFPVIIWSLKAFLNAVVAWKRGIYSMTDVGLNLPLLQVILISGLHSGISQCNLASRTQG